MYARVRNQDGSGERRVQSRGACRKGPENTERARRDRARSRSSFCAPSPLSCQSPARRFACPSTSPHPLHSTPPVHRCVWRSFSPQNHGLDASPAHGGDLANSPSRHPGCPCPGESAGTSGICLKPQALFSNERETPFVLYASLRSPSTLPVALYGRQL